MWTGSAVREVVGSGRERPRNGLRRLSAAVAAVVAAATLLATTAPPARAQAPGSTGAAMEQSLREERATFSALLGLRGVLFVPTIFGVAVPVRQEALKDALLIRRIENPAFDAESAFGELLRFDRSYRAQLQSRLAMIDGQLGAAPSPPAPAPSPPLLGVDPTSRPGFDRHLEEQQAGGAGPRDGDRALRITPTSATLFGLPLCGFSIELIITSGQEQTDRTPGSPTYGRRTLWVPASEEAGFQVQLFHPGAGVVRLHGAAARAALERKGYLVATAQGWRGTPAYENFVNHGAGYQRQAVACADAGQLSAVAEAIVIENRVNRAKVEIRFTIENPTGVEVRLERGRRTHWLPRNDGSGRYIGGSTTTDDPGRALSVPPGTSVLRRSGWLPCSGGQCAGSYQEDWEGHDASGQPRRLTLRFSGAAR